MARHKITRGLNLPIQGDPALRVDTAPRISHVAILADDYVGMRPTMHVAEGDSVRRGQLLFEDKKNPGVRFTAPGSGEVAAIHRGERRRLQSLVIGLDRAELAGAADTVAFESHSGRHPREVSRRQVKDLLVESGLWTALRTRPFGKVARPETLPRSVFVTAMDTNPLAPPVEAALEGREDDFERGLHAMDKLTDGPVYVCKAPGSRIPVPRGGKFRQEEFAGPHPAGTPGLHIHRLDPVDRHKLVWYINYQDVAAVGRLFATGELDVTRFISLAGPSVRNPRLLKTRLGAATRELTKGELAEETTRIVSGSVLSGRAAGDEVFGYLGRYHQQITVLPEGGERPFLGWMSPGWNRFSVIPTFLSKFVPGKTYRFTTATNGSSRAMVPIGMYEKVFPFDILPSFLLRALYTGNAVRSEELGCLELEEEDVALCTFVDPGKTEWGPILREVLTIIEKEG